MWFMKNVALNDRACQNSLRNDAPRSGKSIKIDTDHKREHSGTNYRYKEHQITNKFKRSNSNNERHLHQIDDVSLTFMCDLHT